MICTYMTFFIRLRLHYWRDGDRHALRGGGSLKDLRAVKAGERALDFVGDLVVLFAKLIVIRQNFVGFIVFAGEHGDVRFERIAFGSLSC